MLGSNMEKKNSWLFVNVCPAAELPAYIQMCLYTSSSIYIPSSAGAV